jgi:hypothetical protein
VSAPSRSRRWALVAVAGLAALVPASCGGDQDQTGGGSATTTTTAAGARGPGSGPTASSASSSSSAPSSVVGDAALGQVLRNAVEEERRVRATYTNVLAALGQILPFTNVVESEGQHVAALEQVAANHGVDLSGIAPAGEPSPTSKRAACQLGVSLEQADIALYDGLLPQVTAYPDVTRVLQNLRAASQDSHLPAFQRCA